MFIKCSVDQTLSVGDLVSYDSSNAKWVELTAPVTPWGVVVSEPVADATEGSSLYLARVQFAGDCYVKASRNIPDEGGPLETEAGGVYVDANGDCGLIAPKSYNAASRVANDLVLVHIR